ncbi:hypothetical protein Amsp01_039250 [Amycolatopsis sp. NBRC 101858]|nr:hypothetical protein Amsp01_039250 [Amycolatopsis sp. NBRC 101858]
MLELAHDRPDLAVDELADRVHNGLLDVIQLVHGPSPRAGVIRSAPYLVTEWPEDQPQGD